MSMTPTGLPSTDMTDDQIAAWLHGSLEAQDAAHAEAMIAADPVLAERASRLRRLDDLVRQSVPLEDPLPAELLARLGLPASANDPATLATADIIDLAARRAARAPARPTRFAAFTGGWRVAAQIALVVGMGYGAMQIFTSHIPTQPEAAYRMLGSAPDATAATNALVMFDPGIRPADARALLGRPGVQVIGEPTSAGAWRLHIEPGRRASVLAELAATPRVRLAEPIEGIPE